MYELWHSSSNNYRIVEYFLSFYADSPRLQLKNVLAPVRVLYSRCNSYTINFISLIAIIEKKIATDGNLVYHRRSPGFHKAKIYGFYAGIHYRKTL